MTPDGSLAADAASQFVVDLTGLTSDESKRDERVQETLETSQYPTATFTATSVTGYDASLPEGEEQVLQLTGTLYLHGVQKEVTWEVKAYRQGDAISALATITVAFADFNMTAPTFAQIVSIGRGDAAGAADRAGGVVKHSRLFGSTEGEVKRCVCGG